ncbi:MAG TPA: hypothetical protein VGM98_07625, partial [Schlesneria sp.]
VLNDHCGRKRLEMECFRSFQFSRNLRDQLPVPTVSTSELVADESIEAVELLDFRCVVHWRR